ncbi:uncharacterized protein LOC118317490 isoform X2 [Scophthalmus maximus]|uniref:uncharacterized protein LOC118317490 isoform X2 n=1 Tax=Scophthalmus maximus TaxID=52904 RepID=UPI0015E11783|nr:uncharacterized protein LOC118317490 isoform X2 [Scophthalmus maximus]
MVGAQVLSSLCPQGRSSPSAHVSTKSPLVLALIAPSALEIPARPTLSFLSLSLSLSFFVSAGLRTGSGGDEDIFSVLLHWSYQFNAPGPQDPGSKCPPLLRPVSSEDVDTGLLSSEIPEESSRASDVWLRSSPAAGLKQSAAATATCSPTRSATTSPLPDIGGSDAPGEGEKKKKKEVDGIFDIVFLAQAPGESASSLCADNTRCAGAERGSGSRAGTVDFLD